MKPWDLSNLEDNQTLNMNWIVPGSTLKKPVFITKIGERLWLKFPFSRPITEEIKKSFVGYKWHGYADPPVKQWSVKHCQHNWFQILFLAGLNPYEPYDRELIKYEVIEEDPKSKLKR